MLFHEREGYLFDDGHPDRATKQKVELPRTGLVSSGRADIFEDEIARRVAILLGPSASGLDRLGGIATGDSAVDRGFRFLDRAVYWCLRAVGRRANRSTARHVCSQLLAQLDSGTTSLEYVAPLRVWGWPRATRLAPGVFVRSLNIEEAVYMEGSLLMGSLTFPPSHALVIRREVPLSAPAADPWPEIRQVELAFALHQIEAGPINSVITAYTQNAIAGDVISSSSHRMGGFAISQSGDPPPTRARLQAAKATLARVRELDIADGLPYRRYLDGVRRPDPKDRLTDLWISIEGLLAKGIRQEVVYRISTRAAVFAATAKRERPELRAFLRRSYDDRSRLVHGESPRAGWEERTDELESVIARMLRRCLREGRLPDGDRLDSLALVS